MTMRWGLETDNSTRMRAESVIARAEAVIARAEAVIAAVEAGMARRAAIEAGTDAAADPPK